MRIKLGFFLLVSGFAAQGMQPTIPWGMSSRANGKMIAHRSEQKKVELKFEQEDTFSQVYVSGGKWFAVFDGHGGPHDRDRACDQLRDNLHLYFERAQGNEQNRFLTAFSCIETEIIKNRGVQQNGAMAVAVYVKDGQVHVAHTGDSRAVFFGINEKDVSFATKDHIFENEKEGIRIKQVYSEELIFKKKVYMKDETHSSTRINGLPTTRVVGNCQAKCVSKTNPKGDGAIIATPEYASFDLSQKNQFVILASDGIWEVMTDDEAAQIIRNAMADTIENLRKNIQQSLL